MMINLCIQSPHISSLNISWGEARELPVHRRDVLLKILDEQREKEAGAYSRF